MAQSFEYKVVELCEGMVGGKMSGDKLEKTLNEHGRQGWQLKAVTAVEIKSRIGLAVLRACSSPSSGRRGSR
jgi:hypothetical protein